MLAHPVTVPHSAETFIHANGIDICYDTFGDPANPPVLLIHGLGMQMTGWDPAMCAQLADAGYWVIRFDNRDIGRSTWLDDVEPPSFTAFLRRRFLDHPIDAPYTLDDMAADAVGLLDALDIDAAHVVGMSMGGMIAQLVAIQYPERVLTLTSWMSTTGEPDLPSAATSILIRLVRPGPEDRDGVMQDSVEWAHLLYGSRYPVDEEYVRRRSGERYDRSFHPVGSSRQTAAVTVAPGRRAALRKVMVPSLVIHGDEDPLVPLACGLDTEFALPNSRLLILPGVGHVAPPETWADTLDALTATFQRAA